MGGYLSQENKEEYTKFSSDDVEANPERYLDIHLKAVIHGNVKALDYFVDRDPSKILNCYGWSSRQDLLDDWYMHTLRAIITEEEDRLDRLIKICTEDKLKIGYLYLTVLRQTYEENYSAQLPLALLNLWRTAGLAILEASSVCTLALGEKNAKLTLLPFADGETKSVDEKHANEDDTN